MTTDIASVAEKHRRTIGLFHYATFNTIVQLICLGDAVTAEPITFGDFSELIVCTFEVTSEIAPVAE